jgi:DNA-binding NtrC family response regulator
MPHGQSVLIVDDDEGLAQIVELILSQEGFKVRTAYDGVRGCADYFRDPTEWVVTDIQMPELDGLQMMQCIRAVNPHVKAVYMSGEVERYHAALDEEIAKFDARVLAKPFTRSSLLEHITAGTKDDAQSAAAELLGTRHATKEDV